MSVSRDFAGQSGTVYRYVKVEPDGPAPLGSGNFIFVRASGKKPAIIFAGEGERLAEAIPAAWRQAVELHAATDIFARKTVSYKIRRDELEDLLAAHAPIMNRAPEA